MISKLMHGIAMAAFLAANTLSSAQAQPSIPSYDPSQDMGGVKPSDYMNGLLEDIRQNHYRKLSKEEMRHVYRIAMNDALGPHHKIKPKDNSEWVKMVADAVMKRMDAHSAYYNQSEYEAMLEKMNGNPSNIGVIVAKPADTLIVQKPIEGSLAEKAGIKPFDEILRINGQETKGLSAIECLRLMTGNLGESVTLLLKHMDSSPYEVTLTYEKTQMPLIYVDLMNDNIAYVRLKSFGKNSTEGIKFALEILGKKSGSGLNGAVLDLRNNPGGLLQEAVGTSDLFMDSGIIVKERTKLMEEPVIYEAKDVIKHDAPSRKDDAIYIANKGDILKGKPLAILIDAGSASASEIVAKALQANKRAIIIGERSFGKGSVQTIMPLTAFGISFFVQSGALRYTTGLYFGPDDRSPQERGVTPDILVQNDWKPVYDLESNKLNILPNPDPGPAELPKKQCALTAQALGPFQLPYAAYDFYSYATKPVFVDQALECAKEELNHKHFKTEVWTLSNSMP